MTRTYAVGDWVIYTQKKQSPVPGPRAKNINPAQHGELYSYQVDKFWIVAETRGENEIILKTRRGKMHLVSSDDIRLRKARWWERILLKGRFPSIDALATPPTVAARY